MPEYDYAEWTERHYRDRLNEITARLRDLADRVEREGTPRATKAFDGTDRFAWAAHNALHELTWGIANLNAPSLIIAANQADTATESEAR